MTATDQRRPRIDQRVAGILARHPDPTISRDVLRATLPDGAPTTRNSGYRARRAQTGRAGQSGGNSVTSALRCALQDFQRAGWISRDGQTNHIIDRASLARYATGAEPMSTEGDAMAAPADPCRIFRHEVPVDDRWHEVRLSMQILHVGCRHADRVEFWAAHRVDFQHDTPRWFRVVGTGHSLPEPGLWRHAGTAVVSGGALVWHLIESVYSGTYPRHPESSGPWSPDPDEVRGG